MSDGPRAPRGSRLARGAVALALLACSGSPAADAGDAARPDAAVPDAGPIVVVLPDDREPCAAVEPLRNPYFGDLHVHTVLSFDAAAYGTRTRPRDAYLFARGQEIGRPPYDASGAPLSTARLARPLDFAAVTDHAEFLAETDLCTDPSSPAYESSTCVGYRTGDSSRGDYGELTNLLIMPGRRARICAADRALCDARDAAAWQEIQDAAEEAQDRTSACAFTSFVGYEWTGTDGGTNLHRNVIFRGRSVPRVPTSYLEATTPEAFWTALEASCLETGTPCDAIAIPHNGNLSGGNMFVPVAEEGGAPYTAEQAARRARLEPLVEIYQHKGASECAAGLAHPLASDDPLCDFERLHPSICTGAPSDPEGCARLCDGGGVGFLGDCVHPSDFARGAYRTGLAEWARLGVDPFAFGVIGSTDTHVSLAGGVEEPAYAGHAGENEDEPEEQLQVPEVVLVRGRTASAGGLAVVWAEENSREALFDAMRRRETYATSGTRIVVRFFGGFSYDAAMCGASDAVATGYAHGVPMGSDLAAAAGGAAPVFFVSALRDAMSAPLQRVQIVKGWLEGSETRERVYEVAGDPANGASVDEATCAPVGTGADSLCAVWTDPDFDPAQPAFYYARVVENPTCRWSRYACNRLAVDCASTAPSDPLGACCDPAIDHTVQERAWTSPIWYRP